MEQSVIEKVPTRLKILLKIIQYIIGVVYMSMYIDENVGVIIFLKTAEFWQFFFVIYIK